MSRNAGVTGKPYRKRIAICQVGLWKCVHHGGSAMIQSPAISFILSLSFFFADLSHASDLALRSPSKSAACYRIRPFEEEKEPLSPSAF